MDLSGYIEFGLPFDLGLDFEPGYFFGFEASCFFGFACIDGDVNYRATNRMYAIIILKF